MGDAVQAVSVSSAPFWCWWLVPVVVTGLVVTAARLASRGRRPRDGFDAVDDYTRFRTAMSDVRRPRSRTTGPAGDCDEGPADHPTGSPP